MPDVVFVPGATYRESLFVSSDRGLRVRAAEGETILLHAERISGPWRPMSSDSVPRDGCWLAQVPQEYEPEVATEVRWQALPPGAATFNLAPRDDGARDVRFSAPGEYRVVATSASPCGGSYSGDTIFVLVTGP